MKKNIKQKGYIALLTDILGERPKKNIQIKNLKDIFERLFYEENDYGYKIPPRLVKAVKLYYHLEKNSKGNYCNSQKEVGKQLTSNKSQGVSSTRAGQLIHRGLRYLRHPTRIKYLKNIYNSN